MEIALEPRRLGPWVNTNTSGTIGGARGFRLPDGSRRWYRAVPRAARQARFPRKHTMTKLSLKLFALVFLAGCEITVTGTIDNGKACTVGSACKSGLCATQDCSAADAGVRSICASGTCGDGGACAGGDGCLAVPDGTSLCVPMCL